MKGLRYLLGFAIWIAFAIGAQNASHESGGQAVSGLFWLTSLVMFGGAAWRALKRQRPAVTPAQKDEVVSVCVGRPVQSPSLQQAYDALPGYCRAMFAASAN